MSDMPSALPVAASVAIGNFKNLNKAPAVALASSVSDPVDRFAYMCIIHASVKWVMRHE
jgi:hypothetical protein